MRLLRSGAAMTPTIPQPPFALPPATRDETAPRSLPIRGGQYQLHGMKKSLSDVQLKQKQDALVAARFAQYGKDDDEAIPLDKLLR